ncbi:MAG: uroporphyrinogen decarboxylase [Actinobacteria bacterium]|nr:uroporphyrinogen decarboxylase [Actinomycetota bacterium]
MTLTSRERVKIALEHKEPDRVPLDITITVKPYQDLIDYLNISDDLWWDEWAHIFPKPEVLKKLNVDVMHIPFGITAKDLWNKNSEIFEDEWGCLKKCVQDRNGGFLYQLEDHPLKDAESIDDILNYKWPSIDEPRIEGLKEYVKELYSDTEFALTMNFGGNIFERAHYLRGMENFFMDLLINPDMATAVMKKILEINLHRNKQILQEIGKYLTYFRIQGEDLGSQTAPLISLELFRKRVKPFLQTEWQEAKKEFLKQNPNGKLAVHSCGAVYGFIEDFIEMGADILNPVQPNASGMDTRLIKEKFGERLSFHGAINSQETISHGTTLDLINEVKIRIENLSQEGGYILSPSHNIQSGVLPQKIIAMYQAALEFGKY